MDQATTFPTAARLAPLCGVYQIANIISGESYIGSSRDIGNRWRIHQRHLKAGVHHNHRLQRAWQTHGTAAFTVTVLETCDAANLVAVEQRYMDALAPRYNIAPRAGHAFSEECRAKIRAVLANAWTPAMRERLRLVHLGKPRSLESRARQGATLRGHAVSEETRRKISEANKRRPHGPHTPETVARMTAFQRARRASEKAAGKPLSEAERRHLDEMHAQMRGRRQGHKEIEKRRAAIRESAERRRHAQPAGLLTTAEAATWLGVAYGTVARWMREGRLPARKTPCGRMVAQSDLAAFLVQLRLFPD